MNTFSTVAIATTHLLPLRLHYMVYTTLLTHHLSKSVWVRSRVAAANLNYSRAIYNNTWGWVTVGVEILHKGSSIQSLNWAETSGTMHGNRLSRIGNILTHHAHFLLQWRTGMRLFLGQGRRRWNSGNVNLLHLNLSMSEFYFSEYWSCWPFLFQV